MAPPDPDRGGISHGGEDDDFSEGSVCSDVTQATACVGNFYCQMEGSGPGCSYGLPVDENGGCNYPYPADCYGFTIQTVEEGWACGPAEKLARGKNNFYGSGENCRSIIISLDDDCCTMGVACCSNYDGEDFLECEAPYVGVCCFLDDFCFC